MATVLPKHFSGPAADSRDGRHLATLRPVDRRDLAFPAGVRRRASEASSFDRSVSGAGLFASNDRRNFSMKAAVSEWPADMPKTLSSASRREIAVISSAKTIGGGLEMSTLT